MPHFIVDKIPQHLEVEVGSLEPVSVLFNQNYVILPFKASFVTIKHFFKRPSYLNRKNLILGMSIIDF